MIKFISLALFTLNLVFALLEFNSESPKLDHLIMHCTFMIIFLIQLIVMEILRRIKEIKEDIQQEVIKYGLGYCDQCAGKFVQIRGKYPKSGSRIICPTCTQDQLDELKDYSEDGKTNKV